jgi:hypothetical protein
VNDTQFPSELDTIVEECLSDILRGESTLAQCLARYPEHAANLKPILQAALLTHKLKAPQMSAQRVQALDQQLRAQMHKQARPTQRSNKVRVWQPFARLAAAVLMTLVLVFASGAGLVFASANTLPGDTLYPVKRAWEGVKLTVAAFVGRQDEVWLEVAKARLDEARRLDEQGRLNEQALVDLYTAVAKAIRTADAATMPAVIVFSQEVHTTLTNVTPHFKTLPIYNDVWAITTLTPAGTLLTPAETPPSQVLPTFVPTLTHLPATPTSEVTIEVTLETTPEAAAEVTPEATAETTVEATETVSATRTPRIPPTPTRTPTPTPTITNTPLILPTPTATFTQPPIGWQTPVNHATLPPNVTATPVPQTPLPPTSDATARIRDTQRAVYATQTAGPPVSTPSS